MCFPSTCGGTTSFAFKAAAAKLFKCRNKLIYAFCSQHKDIIYSQMHNCKTSFHTTPTKSQKKVLMNEPPSGSSENLRKERANAKTYIRKCFEKNWKFADKLLLFRTWVVGETIVECTLFIVTTAKRVEGGRWCFYVWQHPWEAFMYGLWLV